MISACDERVVRRNGGALLADRKDPALIAAAQRGDVEARNRLIVANLGLIHAAIRKALGERVDSAEYEAVGVEGFIRAVMAYKPERGTMLSTYAVRTVYRWVRDDVAQNGGTIRVPRMSNPGTAPHRLAAAAKARRCGSLNTERFGKKNATGFTFASLLLAREEETGGEERDQLRADLLAGMEMLDPRVRGVVWARVRGLKLREVAAAMKLSRCRVWQMEGEAFTVLRVWMDLVRKAREKADAGRRSA